ncbi:MAG: sigma-70 family RNA polymerase sigma factor [Clostridiales bacterium]|nr:sigma-70 family RNA polymerase sigma factor [Clostridiales bacterium]
MANDEKTRFIFLRSFGGKFFVTEEVYEEETKKISRIRTYEYDHGRCSCPKRLHWKCDADCDICEFHSTGTLSLDAGNSEDGVTLYNSDPKTTLSVEKLVEDRMLLEKLIKRFRELDPDADRILQMWIDDNKTSDRKIARALGRPQRTFADQMKRIRDEFRKIRGY